MVNNREIRTPQIGSDIYRNVINNMAGIVNTSPKKREKERKKKTFKTFRIKGSRPFMKMWGEEKDFLNETNEVKTLKEMISKFDS